MSERDRAYAIGDFHLGCGDELEDFQQDGDFARFVTGIADPSTTFFVNGDFVDFIQIPPFAVSESPLLLWDENASLEKLDRAIAAHQQCFDALGQFLGAGGELVVLVGNHDLDFAWPGVQQRLRQEIHASRDRLRFTIGAERYHGVHIQHGFHFCVENSPVNPDDFIHEWPDGSGATYLERVWGTEFMLSCFNDLERRYPFADNVKPMLKVLYHGIRRRWISAAEAVRLAKFLKRRGVPWSAVFAAALDLSTPPEGIDQSQATSLVLGAFDDDDWKAAITEGLVDEEFTEQLVVAVRALPPTDILFLEQGTPVELGLDAVADSVATDAASLGVFREKRDLRAAKQLYGGGVTHVVFGHTHEVVDGNANGDTYFNPGTWLPRLDLTSPYVKAALKDGVTPEVLNNRRLYIAERRAVEILPDDPHASHVRLIDCT